MFSEKSSGHSVAKVVALSAMTHRLEESPTSATPRKRLRPHERVRAHLTKEFLDLPDGTRLPTAQEVADQLDVGLSTVQKTFRKLAGENRLKTIAGSGTYVINKRNTERPGTLEVAVVFGIINDHAVEIWQNRIGGAIMQAAGESSESINIRPIRTLHDQPRGVKVVADAISGADGVIIFPSPFFDDLARLAQRRNIPYVSLHPHLRELTENFVSADYISICRRAGEAWLAYGRRKIALIQAHPSGPSPSNFLRAAGILDAINERLGRGVDLRIIDSVSATEAAGREAAACLFEKEDYKPDAVFCMGDLIAHGFLEWLKDHGIACPGEVSIISGTGMQYSENPIPNPFPGITASRQPLDRLGRELLQMLLRRIQDGRSQPGIYLPAPFIGGATTTEKENALLMG